MEEIVLDWLEQADRLGLAGTLDELNQLIDEAPLEATNTNEYNYLCGFRDHKFLTEEIA